MQPRTADDWMKRGILPFYKIGHSVAFRWGLMLPVRGRAINILSLRGSRVWPFGMADS
jgi:hypothetical protein